MEEDLQKLLILTGWQSIRQPLKIVTPAVFPVCLRGGNCTLEDIIFSIGAEDH